MRSKNKTFCSASRGIFFWGYVFLGIATACFVLEGILLWLLLSYFLSCFLSLIGILCAVICLFIFFVGFVWEKTWLRYALCFFWTILILWAHWAIIPKIEILGIRRQSTRELAKSARELAKNEPVILQLVSEIESLRSQTHRLPENESELVKLRSQAMPLSAWKTPLEYIKDPNESEYVIWTVSSDYSWVVAYNSRNLKVGIRRYYD
jgi:hypothetical protein